ncbi:MAG TPA: glycosyltransferase family 4 protein [Gaiellaceae bacterium]|jgi:glycosyltransferase involved in cell wall biosynthesis
MPRHDVALYAASSFSAGFYDRTRARAGGSERQLTLLARALAARGYRVAHVVYPPEDPIALDDPRLTLVHRGPYAGNRRIVGDVLEAMRVARALRRADASVTVVMSGSPAVGIAALVCRLSRRAFAFSSASDSNFTFETMSNRLSRSLYRLGVRLADAVVVQSQHQYALAHQSFPTLSRVVCIPSFAESAPTTSAARDDSGVFLWVGRLVSYKQPLRYVELARAVPEARFVMIAVPEEATAQEVEALRAAVRDVRNLTVLDPLPHERLSELVAQAVAVVNSSTFEGVPNTFLEAWAHGVPVLTLQCDPDGVVAARGLGRAAGGSWDRFVEGARELWAGRHDREELARRTRAYAQEVHSVDAVAARWSELIDELAGGR